MNSPDKRRTLRGSDARPKHLVEDAVGNTPSEVGDNFNRLAITAAFEQAMARMASDPAIRAECRLIAQEFRAADIDGLKR